MEQSKAELLFIEAETSELLLVEAASQDLVMCSYIVGCFRLVVFILYRLTESEDEAQQLRGKHE